MKSLDLTTLPIGARVLVRTKSGNEYRLTLISRDGPVCECDRGKARLGANPGSIGHRKVTNPIRVGEIVELDALTVVTNKKTTTATTTRVTEIIVL